MKILYLLKQEPDETLKKIMEIHKRTGDVTIVNINENKNYDEIVDNITSAEKVISW